MLVADYTALRAYAGSDTDALVTDIGIGGIFIRDPSDTTTSDNGGTVIVDSSSRRWTRQYDQKINAKWFGATGDASTDDSSALQAWLSAIGVNGVAGYLPDGTYVHDGTLLYSGQPDYVLEFGGDAWLAPTAGWGLKITTSRGEIYNAKVRLNSGTTATRGIVVNGASRLSFYSPRVWAYANVPANFICWDVDDDSYWVEFFKPSCRKDSGSSTGNFAKGVRFRNQSNSGRVWGGDINHFDVGVEIDGSNAIDVTGTAFEISGGSCVGIEIVQPTAAGNGHGAHVEGCRFEIGSNPAVKISQSTAFTGPMVIGPNYQGTGGTGVLQNPNNQPVRQNLYGGIRFIMDNTRVEFRNGAAWVRDDGSGIYVEGNGNATLNADVDDNSSGTLFLKAGSTVLLRGTKAGGIGLLGAGSPGNANVVALPMTGVFRTGARSTANRPSASTAGAGAYFFDTTLGKPIFSNGSAWVDAAGNAV